jgi:uncharacterized protein
MHIWLDPNLYQQESHSRHILSTDNHYHSEDCEIKPDSPTTLFRNALIHNRSSNKHCESCDGGPEGGCGIYTTYHGIAMSSYILPVNNPRLDKNCESNNDCAYNSYHPINISSHALSGNDAHIDNDCEPSTDCTIRHSRCQVAISPHAPQRDFMSIWNHELHCSPDLYIAQCDDTHWLACNPIQQGIVAVLDKEARDLLETFRSVQSLKSLAEQWINEIKSTRHQSSTLSVPQMVMLFVNLGFLIDTYQDQNSIPALPPHQSRTLSVWLHITNACNMSCSYCYIAKSREHMTDDVGMRSVDAVIRSALHYDYQRVHLRYTGGEALLHWPQILAIHDYTVQQAQQHGLQFSATVLSNGTTLTPRVIQQLQQRNIRVMVSLDGMGSDHDAQRPLSNGKGSFYLVQRAIARLLEHNLVPHINVTVTQRNLAGLPNLVAYLLECNLPFSFSYYRECDCSATRSDLQFSEEQMIDGMRTAFTYIQNHLPSRKIYGSLMDRASLAAPHHYTCNAGQDYLVIDQDGGIAKCQTEINRTITTIYADDPLSDVRSYQQGPQVVDVDAKEGCRTCNWRYWCSGGCAVVTYRFTGRNDIRSPNCSIYKALFPEALRLEALRLLKYASPL